VGTALAHIRIGAERAGSTALFLSIYFNDQNFNGCDAAALFSRFINSASSPHQTR
jgi:hypothetical protein